MDTNHPATMTNPRTLTEREVLLSAALIATAKFADADGNNPVWSAIGEAAASGRVGIDWATITVLMADAIEDTSSITRR